MKRGSGESKDCGGERCRCTIQLVAYKPVRSYSSGHTQMHISMHTLHTCTHQTHTPQTRTPHTPVWWRLFLLRIQLLVELRGPPLADLSLLQTGERG